MEIKDLLKERRTALGLSQRQVSNAVGVSVSTYSRWESGIIANMTRSKIQSLANVLHLDPLEIVNGEIKDEKSNEIDDIRDEMFEKYRVLFDLTKKVKPEDFDVVRSFLERITKDE